MKLLTEEIKQMLPKLYEQDGKGMEAIAYVHFFDTLSYWHWFGSEGQAEGEDFIFFGLVKGHDNELGYFSLNELESLGERIERDLYFTPTPLSEL